MKFLLQNRYRGSKRVYNVLYLHQHVHFQYQTCSIPTARYCPTIMSNYPTIHSFVNARTSLLQVMLALPSKDIFVGPASAGLQPFAAVPQTVPANVQSDSVKDTKGTKYHNT